MAQQLRELLVLAEDLSSDPSTYTEWLTTSCNFSSRRYNTLFCLLDVRMRMHTLEHTHKM